MTTTTVALVLLAAVLHASWNALVKSSGKPEYSIAAFQCVGGIACLLIAFFVPLPDAASWPHVIASVVIHNVYYFTLAQAYRAGDLSQVYPLFRGLAPILVTVSAALVANERLPLHNVIGIVVISAGIMSLAFSRYAGTMPRGALIYGLITSVLIAMYTVVDGLGVRASGNPLSYIAWVFIWEPIPISIWLLARDRVNWLGYLRQSAPTYLMGGVASSLAYGLVIYAMSLGAMGIVSSLRETSVIFAAIIGSLILKESFGRRRIVAAAVVATGIIVLKFY